MLASVFTTQKARNATWAIREDALRPALSQSTTARNFLFALWILSTLSVRDWLEKGFTWLQQLPHPANVFCISDRESQGSQLLHPKRWWESCACFRTTSKRSSVAWGLQVTWSEIKQNKQKKGFALVPCLSYILFFFSHSHFCIENGFFFFFLAFWDSI